MKDLYADLLEFIEPYLFDFTGYDEKEQAFNIVQAVKELLSELNAENKIMLDRLARYEEDADAQVCLFSDIKRLEQDNERLKSCLQEIKTIAEHEIKELTDSAINGGRYLEILNLITKAESEG